MRSRNRIPATSSLEQLERRVLLAGDVTVTVNSRGDFLLVGDDQSNSVVVAQTAPNTFEVSSGDGTTTINGEAGPLVFADVTRDAVVRLGDGDDTLALTGATARNVRIDAGDDNNQVTVTDLIATTLTVKARNGNDSMTFTNLALDRGAVVQARGGDNVVALTGQLARLIVTGGSGSDTVGITNATIEGPITVSTGAGNSAVTLDSVTVTGAVSHRARGGNNTLQILGTIAAAAVSVTHGLGDSQFLVANSDLGGGTIDQPRVANVRYRATGGDASVVMLDNVNVGRDFSARVGRGAVTCTLQGGVMVGRNVALNTGRDVATVSLTDLTLAGRLAVTTGSQADQIQMDEMDISGTLTVRTGRGSDTMSIETTGDPVGTMSVFNMAASINMGNEDDVLLIGVDGEEGNSAVFLGRTTLDGGRGVNDLDLSDETTFDLEPVIRNFNLV